MTILLTFLFWYSAGLIVYIYIGYPLLIWTLGHCFPLRIKKGPWSGKVSIVIAGYNEATRLGPKLDSLFRTEAAGQIAEVLIGSDGSDDNTAEMIAAYPDPRVRLISFPTRRGKPAVLDDLVPQCTSDIVILTDARQEIDRPAITRLLENFADERVGVVSGELVFRTSETDTTAAEGVGVYWKYEKFLRKSESRFRSVPGATGAFYALRRSVFRPIPTSTLLDDVMIPMQAIEQGYLC